ncbi:esterase [Gordoniibacillus kamchatkensis]|uniref:Esterase n=1 Tax=Gordoniibacillus kamchatkensis TaxID=1590651 RepID=A0ABR5AC30_9BACL|nr:serine hydrolase domain-containing protein [Paenibacillus sp. VKM B-2647]KIL38526.1 esterase [Paenibacillus sp. VKM B-2647]
MSASKIAAVLRKCREQRAFSGAAYAWGTASSVVESGTVGTLSWDGEPVQPDSLWDLASVTKPIVALAMMKLLEEGELRLDDTIAYFLPDYAGTDKAGITLHQLLTHSGGIPGQQPLYKTAATAEALMEAVKRLPLRSKPGTTVEYTSQGFMIVGAVIEAVTGLPLQRAMQETVLAPVGMSRTLFNPPADLHPRTAATEQCPWRGRLVRGEVHDENCVVLGGVAGHAGLFSDIGDLIRLCQTMLRLGDSGKGRYLQPATVMQMTRNHTSGLNLARGLGWQAKDRFGSPAGDLFSSASFGHTGFTGTSVWMDLEADVFAILLTNRVHPSRENEAMGRVRAIFHNLVVAEAQRGGDAAQQ